MTKEKIKKFIPHFLLYNFERIRIKQRNSTSRQEKIYRKWLQDGKPLPPPHIAKQKVIEEFGKKYNLKTLIETGTFLGDMVYSQRNNFSKLVSIELDEVFYKDAKQKLKRVTNIEILKGDSGIVLKEITPVLNEPCLFWLDGHYSAGFTARGDLETPIISELNTIFSLKENHIVLIDDARCFTGENDYPTIEFIQNFITNKRADYRMEIKDDVIRLHPNE
ncbi:MAG: hypothetical protein ACYC6P_01125 [Ignavibacteriaceae bacterium]